MPYWQENWKEPQFLWALPYTATAILSKAKGT